jgi:hypothetical protein
MLLMNQSNILRFFLRSSVSPNYKAQNIALIHQQHTLYGIWWGDTDDVRIIQNNIALGKIPDSPPAKRTHNSGHPLYIPELNKYLTATHFSNATKVHGFKWGSEYFQQFILLDADPPFRATKRTKPLLSQP